MSLLFSVRQPPPRSDASNDREQMEPTLADKAGLALEAKMGRPGSSQKMVAASSCSPTIRSCMCRAF